MENEKDPREEKLRRYLAQRDPALRNELVLDYMDLVALVARRYRGRGVEEEDLRQVAAVALIGALERFSGEKGVRFSTYALPTLTGAVKNYFRDHARSVRMPRTLGERAARIARTREELTGKAGRDPTLDEVALACGLSRADVLEAMEAEQSLRVISLESGRDGAEERPEPLPGVEESGFADVEEADLFRRLSEEMTETERKILQLRFVQGRSQRETAEETGVSQMYVSRVERRLRARLRRALGI